MTHPQFPHLFSPLTMRGVTLKNRIFSTGHMTSLVTGGEPNDSGPTVSRQRSASARKCSHQVRAQAGVRKRFGWSWRAISASHCGATASNPVRRPMQVNASPLEAG